MLGCLVFSRCFRLFQVFANVEIIMVFQDCYKVCLVVALCFWLFGVLSVVSSCSGLFRVCWVNKAFQVLFGRFGSLGCFIFVLVVYLCSRLV